METRNVSFRDSIRAWWFAAFVACFSLIAGTAQAAKLPDFKHIGQSKTGNSVTLGPTGINAAGPSNFDSRIPIREVIGSGSGWKTAGNYGVNKDATGATMHLVGSGDVFFAGTKYPFQAGYTMPKATVLAAVGQLAAGIVGGVPGLGLTVLLAGAPVLFDWMTRSGVRVNPDTGGVERNDPSVCTVAPCTGWEPGGNYPDARAPTKEQAAEKWCQNRGMGSVSFESNLFGYMGPGWRCQNNAMKSADFVQKVVAPQDASWLPSSMDDIAPYMDAPMDPALIKELLDKGANFELGNPTVTGPSTIAGEETTTTNPDGSKTVKRTVYNFRTDGNTITNTSNTTTTTNVNPDGSVRDTSSTTTVKTPDTGIEKEQKDPCEGNPERVGCMNVDVPTGEIPRVKKDLTYTPESVLGGGACPADLTASLSTLGRTVKVWDWQKTCELSLPLRAIVMSLAAFAALMIVMPGGGKS